MNRDKEKMMRETDGELAVTSVLFSLLVLWVICGGIWMLQSLAAGSALLGPGLLTEISRY